MEGEAELSLGSGQYHASALCMAMHAGFVVWRRCCQYPVGMNLRLHPAHGSVRLHEHFLDLGGMRGKRRQHSRLLVQDKSAHMDSKLTC